MKRLCIDTGGTFTDCLVLDESGALRQFKASTIPQAPERGLLDAVTKAARSFNQSLSGFLHSYANPDNERRAVEICREALPNVYVTSSHEILPVWRAKTC